MTPERFADWLQGFVELSDTDTISEKQWLVIKDHLKLVFDKATPVRTPDRSESPRIKSIDEVLNEHFKKPQESLWKFGDPPLTLTC